ncbi:MAG: hypothetical protein KatS3mg009_3392 [Acidimicrobiia bacterium]|nr:MAG: hypothetical protein KatS3mg009_3392 [Acidimicrobiia bacterium]
MGPAGDEHGEGHDDHVGDTDDAPAGAPPDPMDRIWLHPSELGPPRAGPAAARTGRPWAVALGAALASSVATVALLGTLGTFDDDPDAAPATSAPGAATTTEAGTTGLIGAAARAGPGIVAVTATGGGQPRRRGAGVCVRHGGEILTSTRVVAGAESVRVTTRDGETVAASVVGHDPVTDLTLLAVDRPVPAVPVASDALHAGQSVWVVGAAPGAGAEPWLSRGVVTARDALVAAPAGPTFAGFVETDAMPSAWAAGGALVDDDGTVAGIVIAPVDGAGATYALPMATVLRIASDLRDDGIAHHGALDAAWVDTPDGPAASAVPRASATSTAGLRAGDVVTAVAGRPVSTAAELAAVVRTLTPGATVLVKVVRAGEHLKLDLPVVAAASAAGGA